MSFNHTCTFKIFSMFTVYIPVRVYSLGWYWHWEYTGYLSPSCTPPHTHRFLTASASSWGGNTPDAPRRNPVHTHTPRQSYPQRPWW